MNKINRLITKGLLGASCLLPLSSNLEALAAPNTGSLVQPYDTLSWSITQSGSSYTYLYSFTSTATTGVVFSSLQLNTSIPLTSITDLKVNGAAFSLASETAIGVPPEYALNIYFQPTFTTSSTPISSIQFTVNAAPVYGDTDNVVTGTNVPGGYLASVNAGYGVPATALTTALYIATPGALITPEPGTALILGSSLVLAMTIFKRHQRNELMKKTISG